MSDAETLMNLPRELLSTRIGIIICLGLGMISGYGLLMLKDAIMGPDFPAARGENHIDMKQKILEEEESNLNTLRKKQ